MIALGAWQIRRAAWKEALLARYDAAAMLPLLTLRGKPDPADAFRRATASCQRAGGRPRVVAGRNLGGESGWSYRTPCSPGLELDIGWNRASGISAFWPGGDATGRLVPAEGAGYRLVSERAAPGLEPSQPPGPETIANNHRLYALQWFLFAGIAALIYGLALRKRWTRTE